MATFKITKATKKNSRGRVALIGPSGSGKTWKALAWARELAGPSGRIVVIDTERGSASKYAGDPDLNVGEYDALELDTFAPRTYVEAIRACEAERYDVIVVDSLSHAWMGKDGALEQVDRVAARERTRNSFDAWRSVTPMHNDLVDALLRCSSHLVVTMRAKTEYVQEKNEQTGKTAIRKIGLAPVQRDGLEYEFDLVGDVDLDHRIVVSKSRCSALADAVIDKTDTQRAARAYRAWLTDGAPAPAPTPTTRAPEQPANEAAPAEQHSDAHEATFKALRATLEATKAHPVDECLRSLVSAWRGMGATLKTLPEDVRKGLWTVAREVAGSRWGTHPDAADAWLRAALKTPASEPTPLPLRTSKGETLPTPEAVEKHFAELKSRKHLEAAAKKHGAHPWARAVLIERGIAILETDRADVATTIEGWAMQGREEAAA